MLYEDFRKELVELMEKQLPPMATNYWLNIPQEEREVMMKWAYENPEERNKIFDVSKLKEEK